MAPEPPKESPLVRQDGPAPARAALSLVLLALVAGGLVGGAWLATRAPIAANESRRALEQLRAVLPPERYDNDPLRDVALLPVDGPDRPATPVYRARLGGQPAAAVLTTIQREGYGGPIRLLVGIGADGTVLGVRAVAHGETPGIGDFIGGSSPESRWLEGFRGRGLADPEPARWRLRRDGGDFDQVSGATITSRATVAGVRTAVQYFGQHRDQIFATPAMPVPPATP